MNQLMYQKPISFLLRICLFLLPIGANAELKDGRYFQAIASGGSIVDSLWFRAGGERHPLFVSEIFRSGDYPYDSAEAIVFYGDRVDEAGNPLAEAVAAVPPGATRLLLLFRASDCGSDDAPPKGRWTTSRRASTRGGLDRR